MHPPRFPHPNYIPYPNQWRPQGPRFGPVRPMQYRNKQNGHGYSSGNEDHWCETCDRGFRTLDLLLNHKQQHQKCNIDGCQFIAHPKVITKHIQMQHSTGLYKKIAKLHNPEEIQKWREERKKRYPTKENIEKRNAEIKEKIDRGEKMGMRSQKNNYNGREHGIKRKYNEDYNRKNFKRRFQENKSVTEDNKKTLTGNNKKANEFNDNKKMIPSKKENKIPQVDNSKGLKPFTGILNLLDDINNDDDDGDEIDLKISDSIEDDEYIEMDRFDDKNDSNISEPVVCGALSSLICNYESSDDEITDKNTQLQVDKSENNKNNKIEQISEVTPQKCHSKVNIQNDSEKSDVDSGPEEVEIIKDKNTVSNIDVSIVHDKDPCKLDTSKKTVKTEKGEKNKTSHTQYNTKKFKSKLPSTLLEKLLRNEIRQERNIVLQCIRHIIKNNYFENESTSSSSK